MSVDVFEFLIVVTGALLIVDVVYEITKITLDRWTDHIRREQSERASRRWRSRR